MASQFFNTSIQHINKALEADNADKFDLALSEYSIAVENLLLAIKYEKNATTKNKYRTKVVEFLDRMDAIKELLKQQKEEKEEAAKSSNGANGGNSISSKKKGNPSKKNDDEASRMQDQLSDSIVTEKPNVLWDDVCGLEGAKEALKEAVILPIKFPQLFTGKRTPWKGILLYGPPGTGKSFLAKAVATEANSTFMSISSSDLVNKFVGESERLVKQMFELARKRKPCIIFIDEIDSMCGSRGEGESESSRRLKTEFLVQMNGVGNDQTGVLVLGATNIPWSLDSGIRRRFEKRIYIPLPDCNARTNMFITMCKGTNSTLQPEDYKHLASITDRYSGADINTVVRDALMQPIRKVQGATHFKEVPTTTPEGKRKVLLLPCSPGDPDAKEMNWTQVESDELMEPELGIADFLKSIQNTRPSVSEADIIDHIQFTKDFGQES